MAWLAVVLLLLLPFSSEKEAVINAEDLVVDAEQALADGDTDGAALSLLAALELSPKSARAALHLGETLIKRNPIAAFEYLQLAVEQEPTARGFSLLASAQALLGMQQDSYSSFFQACQIGDSPQYHWELTQELRKNAMYEDAYSIAMEGIEKYPDSPELRTLMGNFWAFDVNNPQRALEHYQKAFELADTESHNHNLGNCYSMQSMNAQALPYYERAFALGGTLSGAVEMVRTRLKLCDWSRWDEDVATLNRLIDHLDQPDDIVDPPQLVLQTASLGWVATTLPLDPPRLLQLSRRFAWAASKVADGWIANRGGGFLRPLLERRLKIGYVSGTGFQHINANLPRLLSHAVGLHQRHKFDVHCFAMRPRVREDEIREIFEQLCESFHETTGSDVDGASKINAQGIHALFDMNGYMQGLRPALFALQPAPVQISLIEMVGTLALPAVQYLVTDHINTPPEHSVYFTEKLFSLGLSYIPTAYKKTAPQVLEEASPELLQRKQFGLRSKGVVFCSFNAHNKFDPESFGAWLEIVGRVEGSMLWLVRHSDSEPNLRRVWSRAGLPTWRLVISPLLPKETHLISKRLCDVWLDNPRYNAISGGTDSLWAGIPLLTLPGATLATRCAASYVAAVTAGNVLTVRTMHDYIDVAVRLGKQPHALEQVRRRVMEQRHVSPLFDTASWVRRLERAVTMAVETVYQHGVFMHTLVSPALTQL